MATNIHLSRLITYEAAWNYDQGNIDSKLTSMAKLMASKTAVEVTNETIQLFGGYGYITEYEVELTEIIPDGLGGWQERQASLALSE